MGEKESHYVPTQGAGDFGAHPELSAAQSTRLSTVVDGIYNADQPLKRRGDPRDVAYAAA